MTRIPTISAHGTSDLDAFLKDTVAARKIPAVVMAATNAKETIYLNQCGDVSFGDPSKGQIDEQTSRSDERPMWLAES
jgi:hypothetical protein